MFDPELKSCQESVKVFTELMTPDFIKEWSDKNFPGFGWEVFLHSHLGNPYGLVFVDEKLSLRTPPLAWHNPWGFHA